MIRSVCTLLALMIGSLAPAASAADVAFAVTPRETTVGGSVMMRITVTNGEEIGAVAIKSTPEVELEEVPGRQSMKSTQWINGKFTSESKVTISVMVTPLVAGTVSIPPVSITVDGVEHQSPIIPIAVGKSDTGELLQVVVTSGQGSAYVGEQLDLVLRIAVKPYRSPEFGVTLSEADMWNLIDADRSTWGIFGQAMREMSQRGQRPAGREELLGGAAWYVYDIPARIWPTRPGTPDVGDVRLFWRYPAALTAQRGFFGGRELAIASTRNVSATGTVEGIDIIPLPEESRPASFTGAVGNFAIKASARPVRVAVGDPITLTVNITDLSGTADMDAIQPPALGPDSMGGDFRIPSAPLAGTVNGATKTFTQTIRPTHTGIDAIPPIEFSWFDPVTRTYRAASTEPIAVSVAPAELLATDTVLGAPKAPAGRDTLTRVEGGVGAIVAASPALVADRGSLVSAAVAIPLIALPPIACAGLALAIRRRERMLANPGASRAREAARRAREALRRSDASDAIANYIAAKVHRPDGTMTRREISRAIEQAGGGEALVESVDSIMRAGERGRFAPQSDADRDAARADAESALRQLDALSWRPAREGGAR
jgi:hypothetical protein